ncbi:hypothetical protein ACFQ0K_10875 [Nocardioides caeni]|uniref:Uncharacterized protein n=1 Tax=Nocardioides caeni TaxID=574700 RepID=A0A4S8N1Y5_9ACTN|nr:hypothetical protein [Nocardioides caeni]THV09907.1 hypothetical protein E9934_15390 [Nocardioides caeni]
MSDDSPKFDRPVLNGLVALVAVALGVGLILGLVALLASSQLGLGDSDSAVADGSGQRESMSIPEQFESAESGPRITLATEDPDESEDPEESEDESEEPTATETTEDVVEDDEISLQAASTTVTAGERIYFSGVYPAGEGAILWVQRYENDTWSDFPASVGVTNGTFSSYVFTGVSGLNRFRVIDRDTGTASNEIRVTVG